MKKHLFLTGEKDVGKSTLIRWLAAQAGERPKRFYTVRTDAVMGCFAVHMLRAWEPDVPAKENMLFVCGDGMNDAAKRFDDLGCAILAESKDAAWMVMDELGPHENDAAAFRRAVMEVLDGCVPVVGVLQKRECSFLRTVANHPQAQVLEVTRENRDALRETLGQYGTVMLKRGV